MLTEKSWRRSFFGVEYNKHMDKTPKICAHVYALKTCAGEYEKSNAPGAFRIMVWY